MIGVLGSTGAIGAAVVQRLQDQQLLLGAFRVQDSAALRSFCSECDVVVNCTGFGDLVAAAALASGANYVDAGEGLSVSGDRVAVTAAGAMPGASGLLVRRLASIVSRPKRLTVHAGGLYRFSPGAAADFVASDRSWTSAAWRSGRVRHGVLPALVDVELPHFPGPVTAMPYLSAEAQRIARDLGVAEADWYTVFDGEASHRALRNPSPGALVAASALDTAGRTPYLTIVATLDGETAVLHGDGVSLTASILAHTARVIGDLPVGTHYAADVLDPQSALAVEEGAL